MFRESGIGGKPFGANLADETVLLETRLLNVNLKPNICCELSRTFVTRKILLQVRFADVLKHGSVTGVSLVAVLTNVLPLLQMNSLDVLLHVVVPGKGLLAELAAQHLLRVAVVHVLPQRSCARVPL